MAARLLGYLVQRTIGYGLRWSGTVEDCLVRPAAGAPAPQPGWSPAAAATAAVRRARHRARRQQVPCMTGRDVPAALIDDGGCRAVYVLRRAGVALDEPTERLRAAEDAVRP
ncbi:hypothetical protein [Streptomyces sp. NPDC049555]|uniref:hypothetical protein n=1 Tax=Streptomyces sp. NPDC049555 TaxID=3154930 RepID=UPI00342B9728